MEFDRNPTLDALCARKSVRVFTEEPVPQAVKNALFQAAMQAPTAGNQMLYTILDITDAAKQAIVDASYDPSFGARPLKRYIQRNVETIVAKEILRGEVHQGDIIVIDAAGGELTPMVQHAE